MHICLALSPATVPSGCAYQRFADVSATDFRANDADKYDAHTLYYQAIARRDRNEVVIIAPPLGGFEALVKAGHWFVGDQELSLKRIKSYRRHSEMFLNARVPIEAGAVLRFVHSEFTTETEIWPQMDLLDDANIMLTRQKNNRLEWVHAWAAHHVCHQDVNAAIVFDNGSSDYDLAALSGALAETKGLRHSIAIDADLPYGPMAAKHPRRRFQFYGTAMYNIARYAFCQNARAVLACLDIDELMMSEGRSVIAETESGFWGYRGFRGKWMYAPGKTAEDVRHQDHIYHADPITYSREKYCVLPKKLRWPLTLRYWDTHAIVPARFNRAFLSKTSFFYHCSQLSLKRNQDEVPENRVRDAQAAAFFAKASERCAVSE